MKKTTRFVICLSLLLSVSILPLWGQSPATVKYVFLFIGDGMSTPQRELAEQYSLATTGQGLRINSFPVTTMTTTHSANKDVTDSAASGTAIACGQKTNNLMLGVDPEGKPLDSIAKVALQHGRKVGIITSVTLNHATPGAFYANVPNRNQYYEIGLAMIASGFQYFAGGGLLAHNDEESAKYRGDLYELAAQAGYKICRENADAFQKLAPDSSAKVMVFANSSNLPYELNAQAGELSLLDLTLKGIELLDNPRGFFLMVEGGLIDYAGHGNETELLLGEMLGLDKCVTAALNFASKHPDDTLIVITGDHETGGLTLAFSGQDDLLNLRKIKGEQALGKSYSDKVQKILALPETTLADILALVAADFGLQSTGQDDNPWLLSAEEQQKIKLSFLRDRQQLDYDRSRSKLQQDLADQKALQPVTEAQRLEQDFAVALSTLTNEHKKLMRKFSRLTLAKQVIMLYNQRLGISWKTTGHTALPVLTTAVGKQAELLREATDNSKIAQILEPLLH